MGKRGGGGGLFSLVIFAVDNESSDQWNMTCKNLLQSDCNSSDLNMYFISLQINLSLPNTQKVKQSGNDRKV